MKNEQRISNPWVVGSSPAGRDTVSHSCTGTYENKTIRSQFYVSSFSAVLCFEFERLIPIKHSPTRNKGPGICFLQSILTTIRRPAAQKSLPERIWWRNKATRDRRGAAYFTRLRRIR